MSADPKNEYTTTAARYPAAIAANANITGIDLRDYIGSVQVAVNVGVATAGTDPTYDVYLQSGSESNGANATNLNVAATQFTNANAIQILSVDTRASSRYLKIVQVIGGTNSPSFPVCIDITGKKQVE